mgnify:CR=1 FL=1
MEKNYWQIDDNLYKVYISADIYDELEQDFLLKQGPLSRSFDTSRLALNVICSTQRNHNLFTRQSGHPTLDDSHLQPQINH